MRGLDAVFKSLDKLDKLVKKECFKVASETAIDMESYARENKAWIHRTGDAERGLKGKASVAPTYFRVQIWQEMYGMTGGEYGYWLENAEWFKGKYAILRKTQLHFQNLFFNDMQEALKIAMQKTGNKGGVE